MILVTGATGFVGQGLVAHLRGLGRPVRTAVRAGGGEGEVAIGEIGPDTDWGAALEGVESVVHLAGRAHILKRERDPLPEFRRVNAAGTGRLARQAAAAGVRRFVLVSSVKAAADRTYEHALTETDDAAPGSPYGISKLEAERALWDAAGRMEPVVLRPPLVYGPGVKANFLALIKLVESGMPLPLGSVVNRRSLIARDNLVSAITTALTAPGAAEKTFYVTDGPSISTPTLIRELADALGKRPRLVSFSPGLLTLLAALAGRREQADSLFGSLAVSGSAFRAATGWTAPVHRHDAFRDVVAWYRAGQTKA